MNLLIVKALVRTLLVASRQKCWQGVKTLSASPHGTSEEILDTFTN